jgi:hypothetical protein
MTEDRTQVTEGFDFGIRTRCRQTGRGCGAPNQKLEGKKWVLQNMLKMKKTASKK